MTTTVLTDEQKAEFVTDIIEYGTGFVAPLFAVVESIEQAVLQSEQVQAWKRDAERYGKLVSAWFDDDHSGDFILMNNMPPDAYQSKADIDEDIDAMERQP